MAVFRALIVSDLHMHDLPLTEPNLPSVLTSATGYSHPNQNPIVGAEQLVKGLKISPEWILCPGDLGDKASATAIESAWDGLEKLRASVHAARLIGTSGNHDVDSRQAAVHDPSDTLKKLTPLFPFKDRNLAKKYWANNNVIYVDKKRRVRIVVVNSCMFHDEADAVKNKTERERGRISDEAIATLKLNLGTDIYALNILMLHHHIRQHPFALQDNSHALGGTTLLEIIKETGQNWFVLHGHQHAPDLRYGEGGSNSPVIFSAGSVAAKTWHMRGKAPRNQLYLVEFDLEDAPTSCPDLRGRIFAWDWATYSGWEQATRTSGLPSSCGFGFRGSMPKLTLQTKELLASKSPSRMKWSDMAAEIPDLCYLIPSDMDLLVSVLERERVHISYDRFGCPEQLELVSDATVAV